MVQRILPLGDVRMFEGGSKTNPDRDSRIGTGSRNERKIQGEVLADLQQQLQNQQGFASYGAIVEWLEHNHGLTVEYGTVYATVRYLLGAKLKQPRPQSYQQNEQVVETVKKTLVQPWLR